MIIRPIFSNSAIRLSLFCKRPAVSNHENIQSLQLQRSILHPKTTLAGVGLGPVTTGTSIRRPIQPTKLGHSTRTEGICRNQHDFLASLLFMAMSQFPNRSCFPNTINLHNKGMTVKPSLEMDLFIVVAIASRVQLIFSIMTRRSATQAS